MPYNNNPIDLDAQKLREQWNKYKRKGGVIAVVLLIVIAVAVLLGGSLYTLNSGEQAVITRFGKYDRTETQAGLKFKLPFVEEKNIVNVEVIRRMEFGFRSEPSGEYSATATEGTEKLQDETTMITSDQALISADWVILYIVKDSYKFTFRSADFEQMLRGITESSYRRVIASTALDDILTERKDEIQRSVMQDLQAICDDYDIGITIKAVQLQDAMPPADVSAAFIDVSSAKEEKTAEINKANRYRNEALPNARGEAQKQLNDAEAYKQKRINEATGITTRYQSIEAEYLKSMQVTKTRLYLEMMRDVLPKVEKIYFTDAAGNTLNFLPLNGTTPTTPAPTPTPEPTPAPTGGVTP